ncbi:hypothetical protein EDB85DRAFT_1887441 [Lactarius pseudohatsudake]|nr:hypothetical protein EDB85DRAFT_1887441 [Lactarius pseudohatsudake]
MSHSLQPLVRVLAWYSPLPKSSFLESVFSLYCKNHLCSTDSGSDGHTRLIMAKVLSILATAMKGVREKRTKMILKKLAGMNDIEDVLQSLRKLEQGELLMMIAQVSRDTSGLKDDMKETKGMVRDRDAGVWSGLGFGPEPHRTAPKVWFATTAAGPVWGSPLTKFL